MPNLNSRLSRLPVPLLSGLVVAQVGSVMDLPAKPPQELAEIGRSPRRRRPSGQLEEVFGAGVALSRGPAAEAQNGLVCALVGA